MPYDFIIKHQAGKSNSADALLRQSDYKGEIDPNNNLITVL